MIRLSKHAQEAIHRRHIDPAWVEAAVNSPDRVEPDPWHPERTRAYKAIARSAIACLGLSTGPEGDDILVITAHFDRGAKR